MSDGEFLAKLAAQTGQQSSAMRTRPELDVLEVPYWEAFQTLHLSRPNTGFGPGAIPLSEIQTYAEVMQVPAGEARQEFMRVMRAMDRSYLDQVSKK